MDFQVSVLCDFAADYQGKLCVQGAFDTLFVRSFPAVHPSCALALRVVLTPEDAGDHKLSINIVDSEGESLDKAHMPINGDLHVQLPEGAAFFTRNLIMNFQGLTFSKAGNYAVEVSLDEQPAVKVPLRVVEVPQQQPAQN